MASGSEDEKTPKQLTDARHEFKAYLEESQVFGHYLSVSSPTAPLRRMDGFEVTAPAQLVTIRDRFTWDDDQSRWIRNDGGRIVTEDEIYDVILKKLHKPICRKVEGVQSKDVQKAVDLWKKHELGSLDVLDMLDDTLWGGPPAVYEPRGNSPLLGPDGLEDARYSMIVTDVPSNTRARNYAPPRPEEAASGVFHPKHPDWLHIGTCRGDGSDIWITLPARTGSQAGQLQTVLHDSSAKTLNEAAANIIWREEFEYGQFPGTGSQQKRAQRIYLHSIIQNQKDGPVPPPRSTGRIPVSGKHPSDSTWGVRIPATQDLSRTGPTSKKTELEHARRSTMVISTPVPTAGINKRRRGTSIIDLELSSEDERQTLLQPTKRTAVARDSLVNSGILSPITPNSGPPNTLNTKAGYGHDPQSSKFGSLSSNAIAGTSLLVSADHQPGRAPVNVPLDDCQTQERFFETLVVECNLKGRAATELSAVSATYMWNYKRHLIRKGRPRDWNIFCEDIRKAWEREADKFAENGCEIEMKVHIDG